MSASFNCLTCNANWDSAINETTSAMKITREAQEMLLQKCVPMVVDLETLGKGYLGMTVAR